MLQKQVFILETCYEGDGRDYSGNISVTETGQTCQDWSLDFPFKKNELANDPSVYPEKSLEGAGARCRNPFHGMKPWCYTTDPDTRWGFCNVPHCPSEENIYTSSHAFFSLYQLENQVALFFYQQSTAVRPGMAIIVQTY